MTYKISTKTHTMTIYHDRLTQHENIWISQHRPPSPDEVVQVVLPDFTRIDYTLESWGHFNGIAVWKPEGSIGKRLHFHGNLEHVDQP